MATFMDVHHGMRGMTLEHLARTHSEDLEREQKEGVHFIRAWADPQSGKVFCLSEGPNKDAVQRVHIAAGHPADEIYELPMMVE